MSLAYPRVLIVLMSKVKADDPTNLLIRTQFGDWPKEHLAQIHSGEISGEGEFCGRCYRIQTQDRMLGKLFRKLRGEVAGMVAMNAVKPSDGAPASGRSGVSWLGKAKKRLGDSSRDVARKRHDLERLVSQQLQVYALAARGQDAPQAYSPEGLVQ